jgi:hypothetical protein
MSSIDSANHRDRPAGRGGWPNFQLCSSSVTKCRPTPPAWSEGFAAGAFSEPLASAALRRGALEVAQ